MSAWPAYPLCLPASLLEWIKSEAITDPIAKSETAVCLFAGPGPPAYLTLNGDVIQWDGWEDETPDYSYAGEATVAAYLWFAADRWNLPQLLEILPPPPSTSSVCPKCHGTRCQFEESIKRNSWCRRCHSRGWVYLDGRTANYDVSAALRTGCKA